MAQAEKDALTGTETTGHEWDGIKELNTPLPRWWVWTFWVTVIWSFAYWVAYPAWPTLSGYTKGLLGYSSRAELAAEMAEVKQSRQVWLSKFEDASVSDIKEDRELLQYAMAGGRIIFAENCAPCHGAGGQGAPNFPVLADDEWIWGGELDQIKETIRVGVRAEHDETRFNEMPAYGEMELLTDQQMNAVTEYVLSLSGNATNASAAEEGKTIYEEQCLACHGEQGKGDDMLGGPDLDNTIWLFEGGKDGILAQLQNPKHGVMPAWDTRLSDTEIKQVAVYVHSLGGGK